MKKLLSVFIIALMLLPMAVEAQCGSNNLKADDGQNEYQSLKIGRHCWLKPNLKTNVPGSFIYYSDMYPDTTANLNAYGRLYNWETAVGNPVVAGEHGFVRGICPEGWHIPTSAEVQELSTYEAPEVHATTNWLIPGTNTTNYTQMPGGFYNAGTNRYENLCGEAYFWSVGADQKPIEVWSDCHCDKFLLNPGKERNGLSVRCVYKIYRAEVTTKKASNVLPISAQLNGEVTFAGYDENAKRGFLFGTDGTNWSDVFEIAADPNIEGSYSKSVEDLTPGTTYYYQAYAVNEFDTAFGMVRSFNSLRLPTDTTKEVTDIKSKSATFNASYSNPDNVALTEKGFLYSSVNAVPTFADTRVDGTDGASQTYSKAVTGLTPNTKYYVRAYVITTYADTVLGEVKDFYTWKLKVTTDSSNAVTMNSATLYATFEMANIQNPSVNVGFRYGCSRQALDSIAVKATPMTESGDYSVTLSNLEHNTLYYLAAFVAFEGDTAYGDTLSFRTTASSPCPNLQTIADVDGNEYNTVQIGKQCWMAENLRTTAGLALSTNYFHVNGDSGNDETYGLLYNRNTAMSACPKGWRVPSDADWDTLTKHVFSIESNRCGDCSSWEKTTCVGRALASTFGWKSTGSDVCYVGYGNGGSNATDFNAFPAGFWADGWGYKTDEGDPSMGKFAFFWTSTKWSYPIYRYISYNQATVRNAEEEEPLVYYSVRCICNMSVTTDSVNNRNNRGDATLYGFVKSLNGNPTVNAGFKYGTCPCSMNSIKSMQISKPESFKTTLNLEKNKTYYFAAFVTTGINDTVWGDTLSFSTYSATPCKGQPIVMDHEGHEYATVKIGTQCWMTQNLRVTTSPRQGTEIGLINLTNGRDSSPSNDIPYYFKPNAGTETNLNGLSPEEYVCKYGLPYNYPAAVDTMGSPDLFPNEIRRGICPDGWHVPTKTDFENLTQKDGWFDAFNILNGGCFDSEGDTFNHVGLYPFFWSSSLGNDSKPYVFIYDYDYYNTPALASVNIVTEKRSLGNHIRCLRDPRFISATTDSVGNRDKTGKVTLYGNVTSMGDYDAVTAGFNYGTDINSMSGIVSESVSDTGSVQITLNLEKNKIYYFVFYVSTIDNNKVWGDTIEFSTYSANPCEEQAIVTDHQGHEYATVQIGEQCWMAKDLRVDSTSNTPNGEHLSRWINDDNTKSLYHTCSNGIVYNWRAAMDLTVDATNVVTAQPNHRGLCPENWHLPTDAEWHTLDNAFTEEEARTAFAAVMVNMYQNSQEYGSNSVARYWSSTPRNVVCCAKYSRLDEGDSAFIFADNGEYKYTGFSVRCLRD